MSEGRRQRAAREQRILTKLAFQTHFATVKQRFKSHQADEGLACADGIVNLVRVLGVADPAALNRPSCREAAANALRDLAPISRPAHDEIFIQLCKRSNELGANFSFVAPLRLLFQVPSPPPASPYTHPSTWNFLRPQT